MAIEAIKEAILGGGGYELSAVRTVEERRRRCPVHIDVGGVAGQFKIILCSQGGSIKRHKGSGPQPRCRIEIAIAAGDKDRIRVLVDSRRRPHAAAKLPRRVKVKERRLLWFAEVDSGHGASNQRTIAERRDSNV